MTGTVSAVEQIRLLREQLDTANTRVDAAEKELSNERSRSHALGDQVAELEQEVDDARAIAGSQDVMAALHLLHAQAHGDVPWRTCMVDPCRKFGLFDGRTDLAGIERIAGPAPLPLVVAS